jgi:aldehyde dehydrogenase (NAD+)
MEKTQEIKMTDAVLDRAPIEHADQFFIGGSWVSPSSDSKINVISASTEEIYMTVAEAQEADIQRAVLAARTAFDKGPWPRMPHAERAGYLREIGKGIAARWPDVADIWSSEMGIVRSFSGVLGPFVNSIYDYYASLADTFAFEERHVIMQGVGLHVREPVGVVAAIVPWNAPPILTAQKVAPALLAGCTIVLKASPEAPGSIHVLAEIVKEVGLPDGVFNFVTADREVSERLVRHPWIDKVTFTGSIAAGKKIASICGERIARCTLELGGKSAAVILDDYDLATAAQSLAASTEHMTGQVCAALTRIIVTRSRHDQLVEALASSFSAIKVGDPFDAATQMGPLAMSRQRDRVEGYIARGKAQGATLAAGGGRPPRLNRGYYIEPTVFGHVDNNMTIAREEIFGPVLSVIPVDDEAQAIEVANDSVFGLSAAVFTNDLDRAYRAARQLRSGTVGHNGAKGDLTIGFGGFKQSGIGREGGVNGLLPFLESKTVLLDGEPTHLKTS